MGTFDTKEVVDKIIANDGYYYDDPRVVRVVEYENFAGRKCWGVVYENEAQLGLDYLWRYDYETQYIRNPKVIFDAYAQLPS